MRTAGPANGPTPAGHPRPLRVTARRRPPLAAGFDQLSLTGFLLTRPGRDGPPPPAARLWRQAGINPSATGRSSKLSLNFPLKPYDRLRHHRLPDSDGPIAAAASAAPASARQRSLDTSAAAAGQTHAVCCLCVAGPPGSEAGTVTAAGVAPPVES
jgi:hypothetical protein